MVGIFFAFRCSADPTEPHLSPLDKKESLIMDVSQNGVEYSTEFWPIEHPLEPPDEDRPVKCPMPHSSLINDGQMQQEWFSYRQRKRTDHLSAVMSNEGMAVAAAEPPARAVRKRHHTSTIGDQTLTRLSRMPPLHPLATHNMTIFQMLRQFNKFES